MWRGARAVARREYRLQRVRLFCAQASEESKKEEPAIAKKILTATGAAISLYVGWHFYQAGYNIKRTEVRLIERFRRLPLYPPPGPTLAELNSTIDTGSLEKETADALIQYFLLTDAKGDGITRDDVVVLVDEELHLGKEEEKNLIGVFVSRGRGENRERKRLCQIGLQEFLKLLDDLVDHNARETKVSRPEVELRVRELMQNQMPSTFSFGMASANLGNLVRATAKMESPQRSEAD
eukprot:GEMP01098325.1.p1 GENE.GEMP01098325.1~~GEMP01098325.1.p1  ORF type:complete len:237 (+),score=45.52 GEMP01098325.1:35-745(+)